MSYGQAGRYSEPVGGPCGGVPHRGEDGEACGPTRGGPWGGEVGGPRGGPRGGEDDQVGGDVGKDEARGQH